MVSELTLRVHSPQAGTLNVRSQPSTAGVLIATVAHGSLLTALDAEDVVRAKVGRQGEWLRVRIPTGVVGYVAAWYTLNAPTVWVYSPEAGYLNIRDAPSTSGAILAKAAHNTRLWSLESEADTRSKLGRAGQWLRVCLPDSAAAVEGYAAAAYLALAAAPLPDASLEPPPEQKIPLTANLSGGERQVALTWNRLGGLLQTLADQMGIDPGVAVAVWTVESGGRPFGPDGRMTVRFENHIFYDRWGQQHTERFGQHFTFNTTQRWKEHRWRPAADRPWRSVHESQNDEWEAFNFACTLDDDAARLSISMGGPQIMGFNYAALGYASARQMFDAFAAGERNQVVGFFQFVRSQGEKAVQTLRAADFGGFAALYNGPGQVTTYGGLIQRACDTYRQLRAAPPGVAFAIPGRPAPELVEVDDLRRIVGLGPKAAAALEAEGIRTFAQLAALEIEQLRGLLGNVKIGGRVLETWPAQARLAAWGDWDALRAFQAEIRAAPQKHEIRAEKVTLKVSLPADNLGDGKDL